MTEPSDQNIKPHAWNKCDSYFGILTQCLLFFLIKNNIKNHPILHKI